MSDPAERVRRGGRTFLILAIGLGIAFLLLRAASRFYTEVLWHRSLGYESIFWIRTLAGQGARVLLALIVAAIAFFNLAIVARSLGAIQIRRRFGNLEIAERIPRRLIRWGVLLSSLFLGLWIGAAFPSGSGLRLLLALRAPGWGMEIPFLGGDVGFVVFLLPVLEGVLILGLAVVFLLFSLSAAGYAATGALSLRRGRLHIGSDASRHLAVLGGAFLLLLAIRFWLAPYLLLLDGHSDVQGIFGFADAHARLPGYRILAGLTLVVGGVTVWSGYRRKLVALLGSAGALVVVGLLLVQVYPAVVQRLQVEPNELAREAPFIEANILFTRYGFGLGDLREESLPLASGEGPASGTAAEQLRGVPIWTRQALLTTFQAIEARYRYYEFEGVTVDRYSVEGEIAPFAVAVREINPSGIEDPNWQNLHLRTRYQAGMGAVVAAANRSTSEGRPVMVLSGIPPLPASSSGGSFDAGLRSPEVFFGSRPQLYAVVSPDSLVAAGGGEESVPKGIPLGSPLRKLALAWRAGDANLLFASEVSDRSLFLFRRSAVERASAIAPFLRFPEPPYPVIAGGRIVWLLDGFTATRSFPLSAAKDLPGGPRTSYARALVKITVDALTGDIRFYRLEGDDPLLDAWSRVFPDLFRPLSEMPPEIQAHIRYPRQLLELQAEVLLQYHQDTAPRFHGQQDVWALSQELAQGSRPVPYVPEYAIYRLPGEPNPEFLLATVFVPVGRQNLAGILIARSEPDHYGELRLYEVAVEEQVPGPRQVEALVEQDPVISQQFSLWRQGGSEVWSGHLHVVPVGGSLLYVEPIFLAAEADAIPELRRFVVSDGRRVAMESTLEGALSALLPGEVGNVVAGPVPGGPEESSSTGSGEREGPWTREALALLDSAEARLRAGDWSGFGEALGRLRALLERLAEGRSGR